VSRIYHPFAPDSPSHELALSEARAAATQQGRMVYYIVHDEATGVTSYRWGRAGAGEIVERWERARISATWQGQPWGSRADLPGNGSISMRHGAAITPARKMW
jgi:hypothetical protein